MGPKARKNVGKPKSHAPENADEFLEAGVDLEERGEKWRAGDAVKALRFFNKSIEMYDAGVQAFPHAFDLAYNKYEQTQSSVEIIAESFRARLQYEVTQQPRLLAQIDSPLIDLLRVATESHCVALRLDESNTDVLFNLAQVYSSLAEAILEIRAGDVGARNEEATKLLHDSLSCFEKCLNAQKEELAVTQQSPDSSAPADGCSVPDESATIGVSEPQEREESWYTVLEPVTVGTLLDTCIAQLETLKLLCHVQTAGFINELPSIESVYVETLRPNLVEYSQRTERQCEAVLAQASFVTALATARFRISSTNLDHFEGEFNLAISEIERLPHFPTDDTMLTMVADAHVDFQNVVEDAFLRSAFGSQGSKPTGRMLWTHMTKALEQYTATSKLFNHADLARTHISRGDCELFRAHLADEPFNLDLAEKSRTTLIGNAAVFFGAAKKVLSNQTSISKDALEDMAEVEVKLAFVAASQDQTVEPLVTMLRQRWLDAYERLQDMKEHHLISQNVWSGIKNLAQTIAKSQNAGQ